MKHRLHTHLPALLTAFSLSILPANLQAANNDPPDSSLTIRGHHVVVNDDDENNNHLWDKAENPSVNSGLKGGTGRLPTQAEPILEAFQISATHVPGADCKLTIETSLGNKVKLWKDAAKTHPFTLTNSYDITDPDSGNIQFYVEGIEPTDTFNQLYISATYTVKNQYGSDEAKAEIKFGVTRADIDVDSNNNGTIEDDAEDDQLEYSSNEDALGKILLETNGDIDNDGLIDCFDGLGLTSTGSTATVAGLNLTPLKVKLLAPYNPESAQVMFTYTANIPRLGAGITSTGTAGSPAYAISQRGIRLWKVDGHARDNGNDVTTTGGHFIPSGTAIPWKSIAPTAPSGGTIPREITLYLEYVDLPTGKTYSKEDILFTVQDPQSTNSKKGYIKNHGDSAPTYFYEKESPDAVCISLMPIELEFAKPNEWTALPEEQVILFDEETRIRIKIGKSFESMEQAIRICRLNPFQLSTNGTCPAGVDVELNSTNSSFVSDRKSCEIRVAFTRQQLKDNGLLQPKEVDGVSEIAWYDFVDNPRDSNLDDSWAFDDGQYPAVGWTGLRGRVYEGGNIEKNKGRPLDKTFWQAGGAQVIIAQSGGVASKQRQISDQADVFFFSGHGSYKSGNLAINHADSTQEDEWVTPGESKWDKDMDLVIFNACAALGIKSGTFRYANFSERHKLAYKKNYRHADPSPGEIWENLSPPVKLGYCFISPLDSTGAPRAVVKKYSELVNNGLDSIAAWGQANIAYNGRYSNACAIDTRKTPHVYWYVSSEEVWMQSYGEPEIPILVKIPVWKKVERGSSGW